jgi:hypothetical protein
VEELLQRKVDEMIFFSEAWFVQNYSGLSNFFALYRKLFGSFDEKYHRTPGITELDTSNTTLFRIYERMGSKVAHFDQSRIVETHPGYSSSLAVFDSPVHDFTTKFDMPAKEFIRNFMK